ncbi:CAP domain-containing protein [Sphingosinicella soli]|uniref:Uncharacterized protein YkwD n=1 Tax=Sphingosinicella soli TaxID=333708 RepID=A0A7W7AY03_9SPHN|nr:CAP domain-containing protein [Sphingosinicella soli]MBB4630429.1 uncharacterized protein YkwD [Sphingosinicella soli]
MLMRLAAAAFLIATPAVAAGFSTVAVAKHSWCAADDVNPAEAVAALNDLRGAQGLAPVRVDMALTRAAQAHSEDLAGWGKLSHSGSDGSNFVDRADRARFDGVPRAENVAWNLPTSHAVVVAWDKSPGHRDNMMLDDVTDVGIGYACSSSKGRFWTMVLGRREGGFTLAALN